MTKTIAKSASFDPQAWVATMEAAYLFPIMIVDEIKYYDNRHFKGVEAYDAQVKPLIDAFLPTVDKHGDEIKQYLETRESAFDAEAWLKEQQADGYYFRFGSLSNGMPWVEYRTEVSAIQRGFASNKNRGILISFNDKIAEALDKQIMRRLAALPFVRSRDDAILSWWKPFLNAEELKKGGLLGERWAVEFFDIARDMQNPGWVLSGMLQDIHKDRTDKYGEVRETFLKVFAFAAYQSINNDEYMRHLRAKYPEVKITAAAQSDQLKTAA